MKSTSNLTTRIAQAAPQLDASQLTVTTVPCTSVGGNAQVTLDYQFQWVTGVSGISKLFGSGFSTPNTLTAIGVMQCGG